MAARKKKAAKKAVKKKPKRHQPESLRLRGAQAGYTVNDLEKSVGWYRDVLGFTMGEEWRDGGRLMGCELKAGKVRLWLGQDDFKKGRDRRKGEGVRIYFDTVQSVDDIAARVKRSGGTLDHEPETQTWGTRDFGVTDPDGFKLTIQNPGKR